MTVTLGLAGDTMLGRLVAQRLDEAPPRSLFSDDVVAAAREADLLVANLECCISTRGQRWPDPGKPFFFRAPPSAVDALTHLGVDAVSLANNHALDYGAEALLDTLDHLGSAGIAFTGAGADEDRARRPAVLEAGGLRVALVGVTDHPAEFAAAGHRPGVAYADLRAGVPEWLRETVAGAEADVVVAFPHWGPNMVAAPVPHVRRAAGQLATAGADLVAGHSAHVFHGVARRDGTAVCYDLGDLVDDYAVDEELRNDLGLLWFVDLDEDGPVRLEGLPLTLDFCHTRVAVGDEAEWVVRRFTEACAEFSTPVRAGGPRLRVELR